MPSAPQPYGTIRPADPSWRDKMAAYLQGDSKPGSIREHLVHGLMYGEQPLVNYTPLGPVFAAQEADKASKAHDLPGVIESLAVLMPGSPARGAAETGMRLILTDAERATLNKGEAITAKIPKDHAEAVKNALNELKVWWEPAGMKDGKVALKIRGTPRQIELAGKPAAAIKEHISNMSRDEMQAESDHPAATHPWVRKMMQERDNRWPQ